MAEALQPDRKSRPTGRPSAEASGRLEEEVMDAAMASFVKSGYAATSMEAIARAAGVTKRTLYRRARTKSDLFVEVVERLARRSGTPQLARIRGDTLEQKLKTASDIMLAWILDPDALALYRLIVAEAVHHPGLALMVDAPFQRAIDAIAALLAEDDAPPSDRARLGAGLLLRLVIGEPLDRAAQGIETAGTSPEKRARAHLAVDFFLAGWRSWDQAGA